MMDLNKKNQTDLFTTINRRFEFCASHRYGVSDWSQEKNLETFGPGARGKYGHGHNYAAHFVINGPVNRDTGLIMNLDEVKKRISPLIDSRYDHKFLNLDTPPFDQMQPTPENIALTLLEEIQPLFESPSIRPVACHLLESPDRGATVYTNGDVESVFALPLSVDLGSLGNNPLFKLNVTLRGAPNDKTGLIAPETSILERLADLQSTIANRIGSNPHKKAISTEDLAETVWENLGQDLPLARIKIANSDQIFVEKHGPDKFKFGIYTSFYAAHRLHNPMLSDQENNALYGVCSNPNGHGHQFGLECSLGFQGEESLKARPEAVRILNMALSEIIEDWNYRHLDLEVPDFRNRPTTGENLLKVFWDKLAAKISAPLARLRLFETRNNRFALRPII